MFEVVNISFEKWILKFNINWLLIIIIIGIFFLARFLWNKNKKNMSINPIQIESSIGGQKITFDIIRNAENLYIANRIYLELITRKAALQIDKENDVIEEIYNSWYELFKIIRNEIKNIPGQYLENNSQNSNELIKLTIKILNDGIRPHLTKYQADFRNWIKQAKIENPNQKPQELQKKFSSYDDLIEDMIKVNETLKIYAENLYKFIFKK